jgi:hypothetical protein
MQPAPWDFFRETMRSLITFEDTSATRRKMDFQRQKMTFFCLSNYLRLSSQRQKKPVFCLLNAMLYQAHPPPGADRLRLGQCRQPDPGR